MVDGWLGVMEAGILEEKEGCEKISLGGERGKRAPFQQRARDGRNGGRRREDEGVRGWRMRG